MKTIQEKAKEYADGIVPIMVQGTEIELTIDDMNEFAQKDYLAGYNEAMRWRDPKEELPKDEQVLVKTDKDEILLVTYWVEKGDFVYWDAPVDNVIGWRPIE